MNEDEVLALLAQDPGNSVFAEYAEQLRNDGQQETAIVVCIKGLSRNPTCHRGRLILARSLFQIGCLPFAIDQVRIISDYLPANTAIQKLLLKLTHGQANIGTEGEVTDEESSNTLAEADFNFDEIDSLDEEGK